MKLIRTSELGILDKPFTPAVAGLHIAQRFSFNMPAIVLDLALPVRCRLMEVMGSWISCKHLSWTDESNLPVYEEDDRSAWYGMHRFACPIAISPSSLLPSYNGTGTFPR